MITSFPNIVIEGSIRYFWVFPLKKEHMQVLQKIAHQLSGWKSDMDKHSFWCTAKRPLGVIMMMEGGLYGYCCEKMIFLHE